MKTIIATVLLACSFGAHAGTYEVESVGCVYDDQHANCVFMNHLPQDVTCTLEISAKTEKGYRIGNRRTILIPARRYVKTDVFAAEGDKIKSVTATGDCQDK